VVKVNARAGTGKTTTLRMVAEKNPKMRGLYIVFNKRAQLRAREAFPRNFEVRTMHSLAYGASRPGEDWKVHGGSGSFSQATLLPSYADLPEQQHSLGSLSYGFLTYFLNTSYRRLERAAQHFSEATLSGEQQLLFQRHSGRIIAECRTLMSAWYRGHHACPHDFYLKLAHHSGRLHRKLLNYDLILVDEGQDLSEIMLDLLFGSPKRIFLVGDTHQGIYGFRHAVDAMRKLPADNELELSLSFRFGQELAKLASLYIREAKGVGSFNIEGSPQRNTRVKVYRRLRARQIPRGGAVLARTNLSLFETALRLYENRRPLRFERDMGPLLQRVRDTISLHQGRKEGIQDPFIAAFRSLAHMENYAEQMRDHYLRSLVGIVKRHEPGLSRVLSGMWEHSWKSSELPPAKVVTLSTVHSAKGEQYGTVILHEDIPQHLEQTGHGGNQEENRDEEVNLGYVAITRASDELMLPEQYTRLFSPAWQRMLASGHPGKRRPESSSPAPIQAGDRVRTRLGPGVVKHVTPESAHVHILLDGTEFTITERPGELEQEQ